MSMQTLRSTAITMKHLTALLSTLCASVFAAQQPNVIVILADDLGWSDTTLYGNTSYYQTPNVERLAKRGMAFTRAYSASPLCSPTRSALLTGQSPARTGITVPNCHMPQVVLQATKGKKAPVDQKAIQPDPVTRLKTEYRTLAETLKDAGYATAHFGKWHLGPEPYSPLQQGFDFDLPHTAGPGPAGSFVAPWKFPNFKEKSPGEHIEDRMAAEAAAWLEQMKDKPFYMNYWMFSVHAPFDAKKANIEKHRARIDPKDAQRSPTYAAMIQSMDDAIGTLLDALDRLKLADNTIIIFTADNGGNMYNEIDGTTPTSNRPLRGGKATMFEGGTRVPGVVVWPGIAAAGSRSGAIIQSEDYYPTLLEGLALKPAEGQRFDGSSILPALKGDALAGKAVFQFFPHNPGVPNWLPPAVSVHRDEWKLIRIFHGGEKGAHRHLLFNLRDDLGEKNNLAAQKPELVAELDATKAVVPVPNPAFDPAKYHPELEGKQQPKAKAKAPAKGKDDGDPALQGWKARDCKASVKDGILRITNIGSECFLGFSAAKHSGPTSVKFRIKAKAGTSHFGWLPGGVGGKQQRADFTLKGGDWEEITLELPAEGPLGIVRLYLAMQESAIEINWIEIQSRDGKSTRMEF
jgi:arylsulfatase A-like enzyme